MGLIQLEKPKLEPVSLMEAKLYLRIDHNDEDQMIEHLICVARQSVESFTAQSLMKQAWRFTFSAALGMHYGRSPFDPFAQGLQERGIEIPRSPFIQLLKDPILIEHENERSIQDYKLNTSGRVACLHFGTHSYNYHSVAMIQVDFSAGYGDQCEHIPAPFRQAVLMTVGHLYAYQSSANDNGLTWLPLNETVIQLIKPYRILRLN